MQESCNPPGISELDGVRDVVKLNRQVSTQLAQILNGPTCRRGTKVTVGAINVSAVLHQQSHDVAMAIQRRIVYRRGT